MKRRPKVNRPPCERCLTRMAIRNSRYCIACKDVILAQAEPSFTKIEKSQYRGESARENLTDTKGL